MKLFKLHTCPQARFLNGCYLLVEESLNLFLGHVANGDQRVALILTQVAGTD